MILIALGAICQILGLWWHATTCRANGRDLVIPGSYDGLGHGWSLGSAQPSEPVNVYLDAMSGQIRFGGGMVRVNDSEIERLQRELRELRARLDAFETQIQERLAAVEQGLHEKHDVLAACVADIETQLRDAEVAPFVVELR